MSTRPERHVSSGWHVDGTARYGVESDNAGGRTADGRAVDAGEAMDLINGLQIFIRVVETGSFSAVARESNASQSAVTRQVAQLEEHFGVRLLHRTTRKLSLTDDGQDLLARARHLLEEADDLQDTFRKDGGSPTGLVPICFNIGAAV